MFKVNYELDKLPYRPIIIVKNCLETIFQFLKIGMVLGIRNMFRKSIAKNGYDLCWSQSKIQNGRQNDRQN